MARGATSGPSPNQTEDTQAATGGPKRIGPPTYADIAPQLFDNGYEPVPVWPNSKRAAPVAWTTVMIDDAQVEDWCAKFGQCAVGLRTGHLVAIDIDILDPDQAHQAAEMTRLRLGDTLLRVGRWPKRLMLYRTLTPEPLCKIGKIDVLGAGQQFVAFGMHPDTQRPYDWPLGESPLDVPFDALPLIDITSVDALLTELQPFAEPGPTGSRGPRAGAKPGAPTRDTGGRVINGRDNWLSTIAFHAVHDAVDCNAVLDVDGIAGGVWQRFVDSADIDRPRQDGRRPYGPQDAAKKVRDKLRLHRNGRLPSRRSDTVAPDYKLPSQSVDDARNALDGALADAVAAIATWHRDGHIAAAPRQGIRASVGLGKSTAARRHVRDLIAELAEDGLPRRVLNLVPSLKLADETAAAWSALGLSAVVLRGYEALDAGTRAPMCADLPAVRSAAEAGHDIQSSVCFRSQRQKCRHFGSCAKQRNRAAVREAQIVVAAYDAMFTGFAGDTTSFALILVDEACWSRSLALSTGLTIEALPLIGITGVAASRRQDARGADLADVVAARQKLSGVLAVLPTGEVTAVGLSGHHIAALFCEDAARSEIKALPEDGLVPGQDATDRKAALAQNARRALSLEVVGVWQTLACLLRGDAQAVAKIWLDGPAAETGQRSIRVWRRKAMAAELAALPILHLDATMRAEIADAVLPGLSVTAIEAAAPHQHVRLIAGRFGMSSLCPPARTDQAEANRRANRLRECVNYVRWHALRNAPRRCLVITYKAIEAAFTGIPGVDVVHYNAVAGLDTWGDVGCLFLIGRPLPSSLHLRELTGALLNTSTAGTYGATPVGVLTAAGRASSVQVLRHSDAAAEVLRAAICDDEVMQALGRGRGVNRTVANPLELHLMADVVLPLAFDRVVPWETVCPDIVQRIMLAGVMVDSPADAARLHPDLLAGDEQARKALKRAGFTGQNPIRDIYREMSVKSARYRRSGRGRSWQRAWWTEGRAQDARADIEAVLGTLAKWLPD